MGHDDDRLSFVLQVAENIHDLETGLSVKIAGWLIAEQDLRVIDESPGNCHPLLLTTGKLGWAVGTHILINSHRFKHG